MLIADDDERVIEIARATLAAGKQADTGAERAGRTPHSSLQLTKATSAPKSQVVPRSPLLASAWVMAALTLVAPGTALAQVDGARGQPQVAPIAEPANGDDPAASSADIVVTAERRRTRVQDAPYAVAAFNGAFVDQRGIKNVADLQSYVPGLHVAEQQGLSKVSIRGIGLQGTTSVSDPGIAIYIDNFYISRPSGGSSLLFDVERVEVLRGPQGTLYGRNATGGVINIISQRPKLDKTSAIFGVGIGSRDLIELRGVWNVPVTTGLAVRLSAVHSREDGFVRNSFPAAGSRPFFGVRGDTLLRGQLLAGSPETIEVLVATMYGELRGTGVAQQFLERNIGGPPPTRLLLTDIPAENPDPLITSNDAQGFNTAKTKRTTAQLTRQFGSVEALVQAGRQSQSSILVQDFDGSPIAISVLDKTEDHDASSVEMRLKSTASSRLSWIVGGYYYVDKTTIWRRVRLNGRTPRGIISLPDFILDERSSSRTIAGFGSMTFKLTPTLSATGGIRYTDDHKQGSKVTRSNFGQPLPADLPNATFPGVVDFTNVSWKLGLRHAPSASLMWYANVSTGYKAGGFNITSTGAPYRPESIIAYDAGIKSKLRGGRALLNVGAFFYDYRDLQLTSLATVNNTPGQLTTNATKTRIFGFDVEGQTQIRPGLTFSGSYSYVNARFGTYFNTDPRGPTGASPSVGQQDLKGYRVPFVATHTVKVGVEHRADLGRAGSLTSALNINWRSDLFLREYNDPQIDRVSPRFKSDASTSWTAANGGISITAFVINIENEVEKTNIFLSPGFVGQSATTTYTRPRTFGLRITYNS